MVRTNRDNLLEVALKGEITHSAIAPSYTTGWDERPTFPNIFLSNDNQLLSTGFYK
jgi:hypothetical protein